MKTVTLPASHVLPTGANGFLISAICYMVSMGWLSSACAFTIFFQLRHLYLSHTQPRDEPLAETPSSPDLVRGLHCPWAPRGLRHPHRPCSVSPHLLLDPAYTMSSLTSTSNVKSSHAIGKSPQPPHSSPRRLRRCASIPSPNPRGDGWKSSPIPIPPRPKLPQTNAFTSWLSLPSIPLRHACRRPN